MAITRGVVLEGPIESTWPKPAPSEAFSGLLGEFVAEMASHTEADPQAVLVQALVMFGNIVGRGPHFMVGATRHGLNMFAQIVGPTGSGRKGMGRDLAWRLVEYSGSGWPPYITGLSSGEGLIHQVRDAAKHASVGPRDKTTDKQTPRVDPGVTDKRLLVVETEFGAVLQTLKRAGNTLSPVIRQAWDGDNLQVASRSTGARATAPHISIIGQITGEELNSCIDDMTLFNGFANRFLWVMARRARRLPDGGHLPERRLFQFQEQMRRAVRFGQKAGRMKRSARAGALWDHHYDRLTDGVPGLVGAITSRATPYVMRLACCYALLAKQTEVREPHLKSALAVWAYCEASVRHIFGKRAGRTDADKVLSALRDRREAGLSRREIYREVFQGHKSRPEIRDALQHLADTGFARTETRPSAGGRPVERWFAL